MVVYKKQQQQNNGRWEIFLEKEYFVMLYFVETIIVFLIVRGDVAVMFLFVRYDKRLQV